MAIVAIALGLTACTSSHKSSSPTTRIVHSCVGTFAACALEIRPLVARPIDRKPGATCALNGVTSPDAVACDAGQIYRLGATIIDATDVASATAVAPNVAGGATQWTILIDLHDAGKAKLASYTSAQNLGGTTQAPAADQCGPSTTPCADYLAFVLANFVVSVPATLAAITGGAIEVSGTFDEAQATALARAIAP